jgi:hypothetical protein
VAFLPFHRGHTITGSPGKYCSARVATMANAAS